MMRKLALQSKSMIPEDPAIYPGDNSSICHLPSFSITSFVTHNALLKLFVMVSRYLEPRYCTAERY